MNCTDNAYNVILLYLADIDHYWQKFLKELSKNCCAELNYEVQKVSLKKLASERDYSNLLNSIKGSVPSTSEDKTFRLQIISSKIFDEFLSENIKDTNDLYEMLRQIEQKTISFLKEHFTSFYYVDARDFVGRIINKKEMDIRKLEP